MHNPSYHLVLRCICLLRQGIMPRRKWRQKQAEGALVLPPRTIPGTPQKRFADGLHRPVGLVFASGHLLWTACQLSGKAYTF